VLPETGVSVRADERYGKHITFEVSVPRQRTGSNLRASSPVEVLEAAIHAETSKYADLLDDWDDLQVSRLDLVRDLHGVPDIAQVLGPRVVTGDALGLRENVACRSSGTLNILC
jgi:hypothetical protein